MHWWGDGGSGWGFLLSLLFMLIFWTLIVAGIVLIIRSMTGRRDEEPARGAAPYRETGTPPALQVLQERYARGEIDREEFLQRKADLES